MGSQHRIKCQPLPRASEPPPKVSLYHTPGHPPPSSPSHRHPPALRPLPLLFPLPGMLFPPSSPWVRGGAPIVQTSAQMPPSQKPFPPTISLLPDFLKFQKSHRYDFGNLPKLFFGTKERFSPAVFLWLFTQPICLAVLSRS